MRGPMVNVSEENIGHRYTYLLTYRFSFQALKSVFTGGIDITELYQPDKKQFAVFWNEIQETWIKLFGFKFATAAAINVNKSSFILLQYCMLSSD